MNEMKNALDWIDSWLDILVEKMNECEDRAREMIQNEVQRENWIKKQRNETEHHWAVTTSSGLINV